MLALLVGCAATSGSPASSTSATSGRLLAHGVFVASPGTPEDEVPESQLSAYVSASGSPVAYVYLSNNWFRSRHFPVAAVRRVQARGAVPVVRLMLRSSDEVARGPDAGYPLSGLAGGALDADLKVWAREAASVPGTVYAEYGTEVNGDWFAWNAAWNGQEKGAALFVQAYRHLVNVVRGAGATNVRWIFHVAADDDPAVAWNRLERYYPGGDFISVLGVSAYGAQTPQEQPVQSLRVQLDALMPRLQALAPTKPALLLEFGSVAGASVKPEVWADAALSDLTGGRWPKLRGFSWWDSAWQNDGVVAHDSELRIERQPEVAAVFRKYLGSGAVGRTLDLSP